MGETKSGSSSDSSSEESSGSSGDSSSDESSHGSDDVESPDNSPKRGGRSSPQDGVSLELGYILTQCAKELDLTLTSSRSGLQGQAQQFCRLVKSKVQATEKASLATKARMEKEVEMLRGENIKKLSECVKCREELRESRESNEELKRNNEELKRDNEKLRKEAEEYLEKVKKIESIFKSI